MELVYTTDQTPGYRRVARGRGFAYYRPDGSLLGDDNEKQRIAALAIPPAYRDVWVCKLPNGHLQATGIDSRGRKQYRYHPAWHEIAAQRKFTELREFAVALPAIRAAVRAELARDQLTRERVIAGVVYLLDVTGYRVGSSRYARENRTYGCASLLERHLRECDGGLSLQFRGKHGKSHHATLTNLKLIALIAALQELPGQHLFRYEDTSGAWHDLETRDLNDWLKSVGGGDFTAKQFRTWKATVLGAQHLAKEPQESSVLGQRRAIRRAVTATARALNHTVHTCQKYYLHPAILTAYRSGRLHQLMSRRAPSLRVRDGSAKLHAIERRIYQLLSELPPEPAHRVRKPKTPRISRLCQGRQSA